MENQVTSIEQCPLRIENGKFMRGKEEVSPEIGNQEQIECLQSLEREIQKREEEAKCGGLKCEFYATCITYTSGIIFTCICGEYVDDCNPHCDAFDADDILDCGCDWEDNALRCSKCGREYVIKNGRAELKD